MGCTEGRGERCGLPSAEASPHGPHGSTGRKDSGFTYLELVVVMAILALLFFFSLPRLDSYLFTDPSKKVARLISATVQDLKRRAITDRKEYHLSIAPESGELWVTDATMDEEKVLEARQNGFTIPEDMEMAVRGGSTDALSGEALVRFYPKGYSDGVSILLTHDEKTLRLEISPFLSQVETIREAADGF